MPGDSKIEWTDASWNPVTGCDKVSAGCDHCYAATFAERWRGTPGHPYEQGFDLKLWPGRLDVPLRWTKPRRIFVNSMSDLFHADVPTDLIDQVFCVMAASPRHTFQVLTKRPQRMARYLNDPETKVRVFHAARGLVERVTGKSMYDVIPVARPGQGAEWCYPAAWPLPNVWMGVSVESDDVAYRIGWLLDTPAAVRFLSCEPLIGAVNLTGVRRSTFLTLDALRGLEHQGARAFVLPCEKLDWVIVGGESGPGARPMRPEWAKRIVEDCRKAGVAVFVKQLGSVSAKAHGVAAKGGDIDAWPASLEGLKVREFPVATIGAGR